MTVSISIGDFIELSKLIIGIVSTLRRSASAPTEYQELERELSGLQKALQEIEHLEVHALHQPTANAIKCAALNCQIVLEEFNSKLSKYERPFGHDNASALGTFQGCGQETAMAVPDDRRSD